MHLDNLILNVKNVSFSQYEGFLERLQEKLVGIEWTEDLLASYQKNRACEYHYNLRIGNGAGATYIGYQHNSEKPSGLGFTLKLETNPAKETAEQILLRDIFKDYFSGHLIVIKGGDVALDIPQPISSILAVSLTGRVQDRHKGTLYFGTRGKHGYLKIYDKKKEVLDKQLVRISEEFLTRIEFSFRFKTPLTIDEFSATTLNMDDLYKISVMESDVSDPLMKACLFSYLNGHQDLKEFTRTYKTKIKKALDSMNPIKLDHTFTSAQSQIVNKIINYIKNN